MCQGAFSGGRSRHQHDERRKEPRDLARAVAPRVSMDRRRSLGQQKEPWPSYRISVSRGRPGYLVGVLGLRCTSARKVARARVSLT